MVTSFFYVGGGSGHGGGSFLKSIERLLLCPYA